jgi:ADP-heptose:LPS heptosyltransferase
MGAPRRRSRFAGRAYVVGRALARSVRTAGQRHPATNPTRILVAHHLLLGDTLMLTPLFAKLAEQYPRAEVVHAMPEAFVPLHAGRPYGATPVAWSPREPARSALFARPGFDLAVVPGDNRHAWLARAADARWIVAFAGDRPAHKNWAVDALVDFPAHPGAWGDLVCSLIPGTPPQPFDARRWPAPPFAPFPLPEGDYAVLHVGASTPLKRWPHGRWRALAAKLYERGVGVVWSAGPGEESLVSASDPDGRYPSYAGRLSLPQLWHLLSRARLLAAPDTGVAHLGRIVGVPTVTLFGPGSALLCGAGQFWARSPYRSVTVESFPCRDQHILFRRSIDWVRRCGRGTAECPAPRCMEALEIDAVMDAVDAVLAS